MTVCVTGDVHHMSLETRDQEYLDRTEVEVAIEYAELAAEYGVPVTLFLTGKAAEEEPESTRRLAEMDHVEIGGHGYYAFDTPIHTAWRALGKVTGGRVGSWNGPRAFQRWEIQRTKRQLERSGATVASWRDHAYRHDEHTAELLASESISYFSDAVGPEERARRSDGVHVVPVNTPPDHEHVYHAFRQPGSEAVESFEGPFGGKSVNPDDWVKWVIEHVDRIGEDGIATVLAHPSCLWLADEYAAFERLCDEVSDREPVLLSEAGGRLNAMDAGRPSGTDVDGDVGDRR